jgi:hypothetical protein
MISEYIPGVCPQFVFLAELNAFLLTSFLVKRTHKVHFLARRKQQDAKLEGEK